MNKVFSKVSNVKRDCFNQERFYRNRALKQCDDRSSRNGSHQISNGSSYRHSCYYDETDPPKNHLDFRLRTCYDHAQETFASKARMVVQPITILQFNRRMNNNRQENTNGQMTISNDYVNYSPTTGDNAIPTMI